MKSRYYAKDGSPMNILEWGANLVDADYNRVASTTLPDGKWVLTRWRGIDWDYVLGEPPLIFQTRVLEHEGDLLGEDFDAARYPTEAEALTGHEAMVAKWTHEA
jgi:hypothetical protein